MSSNNNEMMGLAIVGAIIGVAMMLMFALAAFLALGMTVIAICAWDKPLTLFGETLHPLEARAFIYRGLAGAVILPVFAVFCSVLLDFAIQDTAWPYIVLGGYTVGSLVLEIEIQESREKQRAQAAQEQEILPALPPREQPDIKQARPARQESFRFASWDDEEEIKP